MTPDPGFFRLCNEIKHYPWGSPLWIPELIGEKNPEKKPFAELWMGVHPLGPSYIENSGKKEPLSAYIETHETGVWGKSAGGKLPFLFKLLAAEKPLSIQVHPDAGQAREGWERENREGIEESAPRRNYKDPSHKPEILCALGPFTALCGFREADESAELLDALGFPVLEKPLKALRSPGSGGERLKAFLQALFALGPQERETLSRAVSALPGTSSGKGPAEVSMKLAAQFAAQYPGDPGILAPFYLRILKLKPLEAVFLKAGVMHSYVEGFGVELMANSDNVLRGGLTNKHIDIPELLRILDFSPYTPSILSPPDTERRPLVFSYPLPLKTEFSLTLLKNKDRPLPYPLKGPSILCVTEGSLLLGNRSKLSLRTGESAFIGAACGSLVLDGAFTAFAAGTTGADAAGAASVNAGAAGADAATPAGVQAGRRGENSR
ncbi:MAG: mannose-6-phosphate isomerase, class I [Spirochaetaceae bacterium]|nr:mannose-6-phosphate isomerase, class I [Spirochaetaceae bacterium]